jgi:Domain of unknown function (DUF5122) beta-propeller
LPFVNTDIALNSNDIGRSVALQGDGKILFAGSFGNGGAQAISVTRYNADGSLDLSFASNGKFLLSAIVGDVFDIKIQSDGKAILGGYQATGYDQGGYEIRINTFKH